MPQFSESTVSSKAAITSDKINDIINAIGTAFNTLDSSNFDGSGVVTNSDLAAPKSYFSVQIASAGSGTLAGAFTDRIYGLYVLPVAATLTKVDFVCESVSVTTGITVDIKEEDGTPASVLSSAITVGDTDDLTVKSGTISTSSFSAGDILAFYATFGVSDTMVNGTFILTFKTAHIS